MARCRAIYWAWICWVYAIHVSNSKRMSKSIYTNHAYGSISLYLVNFSTVYGTSDWWICNRWNNDQRIWKLCQYIIKYWIIYNDLQFIYIIPLIGFSIIIMEKSSMQICILYAGQLCIILY